MPGSNTYSYYRQRGSNRATPAPLKGVLKGSFDPTNVTQQAIFTLPKGAIPLRVDSLGGATGGTNPTVDIGTLATPDGFANELDADNFVFDQFSSLTTQELTVDTIVFGRAGASLATGGTTIVLMNYVMADDGSP